MQICKTVVERNLGITTGTMARSPCKENMAIRDPAITTATGKISTIIITAITVVDIITTRPRFNQKACEILSTSKVSTMGKELPEAMGV